MSNSSVVWVNFSDWSVVDAKTVFSTYRHKVQEELRKFYFVQASETVEGNQLLLYYQRSCDLQIFVKSKNSQQPDFLCFVKAPNFSNCQLLIFQKRYFLTFKTNYFEGLVEVSSVGIVNYFSCYGNSVGCTSSYIFAISHGNVVKLDQQLNVVEELSVADQQFE